VAYIYELGAIPKEQLFNMKAKFLIAFLLLGLTSIGQINLSGEYISVNTLPNDTFDTAVLNLKCDKTFSGSNKSLLVYGNWRLANSNKIILQVDSTIFDSKSKYERSEIKLKIRKERLYWKPMTKHQFNRFVREIEKSTGEGQSNLRNSYDRQTDYYKKTINYTCI